MIVVTVQQAVLVLQRRDRADRERALDRVDRMVGDPAVAHLALGDQAVQLTPGLFDRRVAVDVVELHQVEPFPSQPREAGLDVRADALRSEILREPLSSGNVPHFVKTRTSSSLPSSARATTCSALPQP